MKFNKAGIAGAGTMGRGIAIACVTSGVKTVLYDINKTIVRDAGNFIEKYFEKLVEKGKISIEQKQHYDKDISFVTDIKNFKECEIVIEAALEDISIKKNIFSELSSLVSDKCILATNTSSFSITAVSTALQYTRERVIGLHFFNPANIMKLVEVISGEYSSKQIIEDSFEFCRILKKEPVLCKDTPAFIVNRVARSFYGESIKIFSESGIDFKQIDDIMREEGKFRMGPFELMDFIGIDVNLSVTKSVYDSFFYDPKYKPHPIQQMMVDSGLLGKKSGEGFYKY